MYVASFLGPTSSCDPFFIFSQPDIKQFSNQIVYNEIEILGINFGYGT